MLHPCEQKFDSRDELVQVMKEGICGHPEAEQLMLELAMQLEIIKGKKSYGYLPKSMKKRADETIEQMEKFPMADAYYQKWWELQCEARDFYAEKRCVRPPLSRRKNSTRSRTRSFRGLNVFVWARSPSRTTISTNRMNTNTPEEIPTPVRCWHGSSGARNPPWKKKMMLWQARKYRWKRVIHLPNSWWGSPP
nr:relaxase MobL [uncultured Oscillibacter sp.]